MKRGRQLFDNVCFQVKKEDGSKTLPEKGHDGRYHVEGRVEIASRDEVKKMDSTAMPLLRAGGQCRKIILTPTARYRDCPCCGTRRHCTNMKDRNYKQWMDARLAEIRLRDYERLRPNEEHQKSYHHQPGPADHPHSRTE
jgi:hypothetical protein